MMTYSIKAQPVIITKNKRIKLNSLHLLERPLNLLDYIIIILLSVCLDKVYI